MMRRLSILAALFTMLASGLCLGQGYTDMTSSARSPMLESMWESGKLGALIGVGAGTAISLIDYGTGGEPKPLRMLAGLTGGGFLLGAIYGAVESQFLPASYGFRSSVGEDAALAAAPAQKSFRWAPQFSLDPKNPGYGLAFQAVIP